MAQEDSLEFKDFVQLGLTSKYGESLGVKDVAQCMGRRKKKLMALGQEAEKWEMAFIQSHGVTLRGEQLLDAIVVYSVVEGRTLDIQKGSFYTTPAQPSSQEIHVKELEKEILKLKVELGHQSRGYPHLSLESLKELSAEQYLADLMKETLSLIQDTFDHEEQDMQEDLEPGVPRSKLWDLVNRKHKEYEQRYNRKGRQPTAHESASTHERSPSPSSRSSGSTQPARSSGHGKTYWRGKYKFEKVDGVEYYVSSAGRRWRTDKPPPGDCDDCGRRHWSWQCRR